MCCVHVCTCVARYKYDQLLNKLNGCTLWLSGQLVKGDAMWLWVALPPPPKKKKILPLKNLLVSNFWSSFIKLEVLNEEEYSILCILYCYILKQHILHSATILTHTIACSYICFQKQNIVVQKPTHPILHYSSVMNMEKGNFTNFEMHTKFKKIATDNDIFS